jgi:hypothetical protein
MKYDPNNSKHIRYYIHDLQRAKNYHRDKINEIDTQISAMRFKLSQINGVKNEIQYNFKWNWIKRISNV